MKKFSALLLAAFMVIGFALAGCGSSDEGNNSGDNGEATNEGGSSSEAFGEKVDWTIVGIDPGAGIMKKTNEAIEEYGLDEWTLQSSSGTTMTASLKEAIEDKKPIVVTGWTPHWMFTKWDLKYLKDPKGVYGAEEKIHTIVHKGFQENFPNATKFFKQFEWSQDDMGTVMISIQDGMSEEEAAQKWVDNNQDVVSKWTKGVEKVDGKEIVMSNVAWASSIASNNVIKVVLEDLGYNVQIDQVQAAAMWASVAEGDANVLLAGWLPVTHAAYWEKYKDQVVDLHTSMGGVKIGLTVPKYVEIDSIEDLKK